ncbi:MAG TPA: hypothetical protein VMD98_08740 [Bryocella sp.]|nr:hypothetical protein [Bryocella sp.]
MTSDLTRVGDKESAVKPGVADRDGQLSALRALYTQLNEAAEWLEEGNAPMLTTMGQSISVAADGLRSLWLQVGVAGLSPEAEAERRRILALIAERRRFCRSMLRRWRRLVLLRRQLLGLESNRVGYGDLLRASGS